MEKNKKYARKSKSKAGSDDDPVLQKAIHIIEDGTQYRQGVTVKMGELAKKVGVTRSNLMRRTDALVANNVVFKNNGKYIKLISEPDARKRRQFSFFQEVNKLILKNKKERRYVRLRGGKIFCIFISPVKKEEYKLLDKFSNELEELIQKRKIKGGKFIGLLIN